MIVLGVDSHKRSHTAVADEHGRKLAERTVEASDAGHLEVAGRTPMELGDRLRWTPDG